MTPRQERVLKLILGALVAIVPATLSYCKARDEASSETAHVSREADAGYQALVDSVHNLERIVAAQGDAIRALTGRTVQVTFPPLPADTTAALQQANASFDVNAAK